MLRQESHPVPGIQLTVHPCYGILIFFYSYFPFCDYFGQCSVNRSNCIIDLLCLGDHWHHHGEGEGSDECSHEGCPPGTQYPLPFTAAVIAKLLWRSYYIIGTINPSLNHGCNLVSFLPYDLTIKFDM